MPIDYKKYPSNWKTEIRPAILERANNCCEYCLVPNYKYVIRGTYNEEEVYQDDDGNIWDASTSRHIGSDYVGEVHPTNTFIKIVLTVAHLDHDTNNNDYENLKALCQRCHLNYDKQHHANNSRQTLKRKKGLMEINFTNK